MPDREKVIKAVEEAFDMYKSEYDGTSFFDEKEWAENKRDAIALLKEQDCNYCGTVFDVAYKAGKADAVVRCKDCKHGGIDSTSYPHFWCSAHTEYHDGAFFCADGEAKE